MAANSNRALTLSIVADIDNLQKGLKKADNEIETFGSKVSAFGKKAAAAFAVAAAAAAVYAGKLLLDGVKAAIEDEKANAKLAATLVNVAGATQATIDEVLAYSRATELATGVTEDQLRPSLNRLTIATKDASEAMRLQQIALDVAAGSGKGLDAVTQAISKAFEGNTASLARLGIGLSAAELKTMSFTEITQLLSDTFAGQADIAANTFEGRIARLRLAFEDVRDTLAEKLLPFLEQFITLLFEKGIPILDGFVAGLTGDKGLSAALTETGRGAESFGKTIATISGIIAGFITFLREAIGLVVSLANELIRVVNIIPFVNIGALPNPAPSAGRSSLPAVPRGGSNFNYGSGNPMNITINAIDGEGAARAVAKVVNQSAARSTPSITSNTIKNR